MRVQLRDQDAALVATIREPSYLVRVCRLLSTIAYPSPRGSPFNDPARCRSVGVLHLDPLRGPPRPVWPIAPLGDNALKAKLAGVLIDRRAVTPVHVLG